MFWLQDTANEDVISKLGNHLEDRDGRHPPAGLEMGENALAKDLAGGNAVDEDFPSHGGGFLDEEDDSGDDTFDANGAEERGEGPTYVTRTDGTGEYEGHGDSSSSSSSESMGADHRRYRSYGFGRAYRHGGASSSSQEEERYDFQDEAMQGDDPSVFDGLGSSYRVRHAGPRALGSSWDSEGDSRSPEVEEGDSGEDSPSMEDNSQSEEPTDSQSEEKSSSQSREDGDGEDSPSREDEDSESREDTHEQSDEEPGESPEVVRTLNEHTWEGQEDWDSAEDRSVLSTPDSESREEDHDLSKSREDDNDQSPSTEDTVEESEEDENDSVPSTSAESQSTSPEDDSSPEDNTGEESRSTESDNSESQEDDDDMESQSQEDATRESSSHGDDSSQQSLESGARKRRLGALRHKPAADYDDNDCQDGY
uniref:Dentin matrix acidic phosphoprotein 1 n=1 Tax=Malurus cyaneus samueli TaxID=2593467 RepID=A0A8C5UD02_9PASS